METVVKVAVVLSVATVAAAVSYDAPNTFQCTSDSPTSDPVFSNTSPPVALTHIFCGEIKSGKAQGYHSRYLANKHSRPGGVNHPRCAKTTGKLVGDISSKLCQKCPFDAPVIEVLQNKDTSTYITKKTNQGNPNKFFPDAWKTQYVVDVALNIFRLCMNGNMGVGSKVACLKNYKIVNCKEFNIVIFTDGTNIITAFPTNINDLTGCDYTCDYSHLG